MPLIREILLGDVLAGAICLVVLAGALWVWRKGEGKWATPVAIGVAFLVGYYLLAPVRGFPPQDQGGWLVVFTPLLMLVAIGDSMTRLPLKFRALIVEVIAAAVSLLLLVPIRNSSVGQSRATVAIVSLIIWVTWFSIDRMSVRRGPREMSIMLLLISIANAAILGMSGSTIYGLQGGTLAAVMTALTIVSSISRRIEVQRGTIFLFTFLWLLLLINGHFWSDVPTAYAVVLLMSPQTQWLGEIPPLRGPKFWKAAVRVGLVAIPLIVIVTRAAVQFQQDMEQLM